MKLNKIMILAMALSSMTNCKERPDISSPAPEPHTYVIKFDKPEYKEHIMVYADGFLEGTTRLCTEGLVLPDSVIHLCGKSPYIELPDNYLQIDWKWGRIYYNDNEAIIHDKWAELKDVNFQWPLSDIYVKYPVVEAYCISRTIMKNYNNGILKYDDIRDSLYIDPGHWSISDQSWADGPEEWKAKRLAYIALCDSAQAEFTEIITRMIHDGNLPKESRVKLRYR